jgi:hypothetical protein
MIKFMKTHGPADSREVTALEERVGRLPPDYREFLLVNHGAYGPELEIFPIPGEGDALLQSFFGFTGDTYDFSQRALNDYLPEALPIAIDLCGNQILVGLVESVFGKIFWHDHEIQHDGSISRPVLIADSFSDFLRLLHS